MNLLIVGYGSMGHEIERAAKERGHSIVSRIDMLAGVGDATELSESVLSRSDVAIEFSASSAVVDNARAYAKAGLAAVVGTTGWDDSREMVKTLIEAAGSAYLWGSNFSIGAHIFYNLVEHAAAMVNKVPDYDLALLEVHHNRKKDSPSGTALTAARRILAANTTKRRIVDDKLDRQIERDELHVASVRVGSFPGIHTLLVDSLADTIEVRHTARSRGGFALGAVLAAEWIHGRRGFFQVEDFIQELF
ncbi:MAG TPA: 4-hydroxy-tetrahydrodipicolinate reductase [Spirochaetia bacterium]|nr:4-hydroxy-tetrahydrodipicolinate reductase [Spirochaetia bacterium]